MLNALFDAELRGFFGWQLSHTSYEIVYWVTYKAMFQMYYFSGWWSHIRNDLNEYPTRRKMKCFASHYIQIVTQKAPMYTKIGHSDVILIL